MLVNGKIFFGPNDVTDRHGGFGTAVWPQQKNGLQCLVHFFEAQRKGTSFVPYQKVQPDSKVRRKTYLVQFI